MTRTSTKPHFPSKDDIVAFIGKQPGKVGTREIARAFGLKNADRAALKRMLRELSDGGVVEQRRKKLHRPGTLPHVLIADITGRDRDGELIAVPTEWAQRSLSALGPKATGERIFQVDAPKEIRSKEVQSPLGEKSRTG